MLLLDIKLKIFDPLFLPFPKTREGKDTRRVPRCTAHPILNRRIPRSRCRFGEVEQTGNHAASKIESIPTSTKLFTTKLLGDESEAPNL